VTVTHVPGADGRIHETSHHRHNDDDAQLCVTQHHIVNGTSRSGELQKVLAYREEEAHSVDVACTSAHTRSNHDAQAAKQQTSYIPMHSAHWKPLRRTDEAQSKDTERGRREAGCVEAMHAYRARPRTRHTERRDSPWRIRPLRPPNAVCRVKASPTDGGEQRTLTNAGRGHALDELRVVGAQNGIVSSLRPATKNQDGSAKETAAAKQPSTLLDGSLVGVERAVGACWAVSALAGRCSNGQWQSASISDLDCQAKER
jgi:hypothetical protein